jgi:hypothetical protein
MEMRMKNRKALLAVVVLLLATMACSILDRFETDRSVLFEDDFSRESSGWDVSSESFGSASYFDGEYRLLVHEAWYDVWANPYKDFGDVDITVEARKEAGPDDNNFGIICRSVSDSEFYMGLIASDGYYIIQKLTVDGYEGLSGESFDYSDAIIQGDATNTIRLTCIADTITLYANGTQLTSVQDSAYTRGDVGLLAGSFDTAGVDIRFDNFMVREP